MHNLNASNHLMLVSAAVISRAAIDLFRLIGVEKLSPAQAGMGATTETAAVSAGAKVTTTEQKLRIEPK